MNILLEKLNTKNFSADVSEKLSKQLELSPILLELLFSRGIETAEEIKKFLYADKSNLYDPFLMKGMTEAVDRLQLAIKDKQKIVIYGDYDVDGICSAAILALFFKAKGLDVFVHIPSRTDEGYGLNVTSIERIVETQYPDLILTCDCGISGVAEVELANELGVEVIVTDHHEAGNTIPDCIVVNPKQDGCTYPDKYLCGAGVAFKLVQALSDGESYLDFLDLVCVATIADLVPLKNENRLIVQLGLKLLASGNGNIGLKMLLNTHCGGDSVTSGDIAYKIAPRINAAGRIGDAYRSFDIIASQDRVEISRLIGEIEEDNNKRKDLSDKIFSEAVADLAFEDMTENRAIILSNPEWSKGVTGIAAARLAGEYNRPAFIMVESGDDGTYKGTSRSVRDINIYELLAACQDLLVEFGGHSGAAGFSIKGENIPAFKKRINDILNTLPVETFLPYASYDMELPLSLINKELLNELKLIEPTGNSNTKPYFKIDVNSLSISPCKNPVHTSVSTNKLQMYAFNFQKKNQLLMGDDPKQLVVELCEGTGNQVNAYVKAVCPSTLYINNDMAIANYIDGARIVRSKQAGYKAYDRAELGGLLPKSIFGTLFICFSSHTYEKFIKNYDQTNIVMRDYAYLSQSSNYSGIVVSPVFCDELALQSYKKIVFLDYPVSFGTVAYINEKTSAEIFVPSVDNTEEVLGGNLSTDREVFATYYSAIVSASELAADSTIAHYKRVAARHKALTACQFAFCRLVFEELGFIGINNGKMSVDKQAKKPLTDSVLYNKFNFVK